MEAKPNPQKSSGIEVFLLKTLVRSQKKASQQLVKKLKVCFIPHTSVVVQKGIPSDGRLVIAGYCHSVGLKTDSNHKVGFSSTGTEGIWLTHFNPPPAVVEKDVSYRWRFDAKKEVDSGSQHEVVVSEAQVAELSGTNWPLDVRVSHNLSHQLIDAGFQSLLQTEGFEWRFDLQTNTFGLCYHLQDKKPVKHNFIRVANCLMWVPSDKPVDIIHALLSLTEFCGNQHSQVLENLPYFQQGLITSFIFTLATRWSKLATGIFKKPSPLIETQAEAMKVLLQLV